MRDYLSIAKMALVEAGGVYTPSKTERKAEEINSNIPYVCKVEFSIGGFFGGFENRTYRIDGDIVREDITHTLMLPPSYLYEPHETIDKECFLEGLTDLYLGEWRRRYDLRRFGYAILDGTQWHLHLYFSNGHKPLKIRGDNAYPYNFDKLLEHLNIAPFDKSTTT